MSLQSIMDATPIVSWNKIKDGFVGSSNSICYQIFNRGPVYWLYWMKPFDEEPDYYRDIHPKEIIDKINELEGIK